MIRSIAEVRDLDPAKISPDSTFEQLQIDSLDAMQLLFLLEDRYGIDLSPEEVSAEMTVSEFTLYLEQVRSAKKVAQVAEDSP